jgi:hypothetical protein
MCFCRKLYQKSILFSQKGEHETSYVARKYKISLFKKKKKKVLLYSSSIIHILLCSLTTHYTNKS